MSALLQDRPEVEQARVDLRSDRFARKRRSLLVTTALAAVALALFVLSMMLGSVRLGADQVLGAVLHVGDDPGADFIVRELRLPQTMAALAVGLALGVAGTLFQQLLRNPLASPDFVGVSSGASVAAVAGIVLYDFVGVSSGASVAAVAGIVLYDFGGVGIPVLALVGALVSSTLMYLLAWRDGVSGYRFILIGIGVSAFMTGIVGYLLTRSSLHEAREAMHWLVGSIGQSGETELDVLLVALAVLVPCSLVLQRLLRTLELGDDTARALGTRTEWARFLLIVVAVVLTGLATAVAGPIVFVALVAGPVANRLLGPATGGILAAAFAGAIMLLASDIVALHVLPTELPTGVVTGAVGAPYLLWLIATSNKEGLGG